MADSFNSVVLRFIPKVYIYDKAVEILGQCVNVNGAWKASISIWDCPAHQ